MGVWFRRFSGFQNFWWFLGEPAVNPRHGVLYTLYTPMNRRRYMGFTVFCFHPYKLELFINPTYPTGDFGPTFVRVWEFSLGDAKPGAGGASFEWTAQGGEPGNRNRFCVGNPVPFLWFRIFWWGNSLEWDFSRWSAVMKSLGVGKQGDFRRCWMFFFGGFLSGESLWSWANFLLTCLGTEDKKNLFAMSVLSDAAFCHEHVNMLRCHDVFYWVSPDCATKKVRTLFTFRNVCSQKSHGV